MQTANEAPIGIEYIIKKGDDNYCLRYQCEPVSWRDERIDAKTAVTIIEHALDNGIVREIDEKEAGSRMFAGKLCATPAVTKYVMGENSLSTMLPDQAAVSKFARWNSSAAYDTNARRRSIITGRFK